MATPIMRAVRGSTSRTQLQSAKIVGSAHDVLPSGCQVIAGLWVLSIMGSCFNFLTLSYICFVLLFTVPMLYEKYEDQVDAFGEKEMIEIKKLYAVFDAKILSQIPKGALKGKKKE